METCPQTLLESECASHTIQSIHSIYNQPILHPNIFVNCLALGALSNINLTTTKSVALALTL